MVYGLEFLLKSSVKGKAKKSSSLCSKRRTISDIKKSQL